MEQKKDEIVKFKFEGVFEENSITNSDLEQYQEFIQLLESKKSIEFFLSEKEIKLIIININNKWKILKTKILKKNTEFNPYYVMTLYLENIETKNNITITKSFSSKRYKFKYKKIYHYCFIDESLTNYFRNILKKHEFYAIVKFHESQFFFDPNTLLNSRATDFDIVVYYQFEDIELDNLKYELIYKTSLFPTGRELNLKLGLYTNLLKDEFNEFIYYNTSQRNNFLSKWKDLIKLKNNIGLCGPFGTGKTITLLKLLIENPNDRMFYVNLRTVNETSYFELIKLFKYEAIKLFGQNIFNEKEKYGPDEIIKIYNQIIEEIEKFNESKHIFSLLENIINLIKQIITKENYYFIIDQYSSKYDLNNIKVRNIIENNNIEYK